MCIGALIFQYGDLTVVLLHSANRHTWLHIGEDMKGKYTLLQVT